MIKILTTNFFIINYCHSAGAGRTGAIITIHVMMQMAEEKGQVDIYNFVFTMRNSRPNIVQTSVSTQSNSSWRYFDVKG